MGKKSKWERVDPTNIVVGDTVGRDFTMSGCVAAVTTKERVCGAAAGVDSWQQAVTGPGSKPTITGYIGTQIIPIRIWLARPALSSVMGGVSDGGV